MGSAGIPFPRFLLPVAVFPDVPHLPFLRGDCDCTGTAHLPTDAGLAA